MENEADAVGAVTSGGSDIAGGAGLFSSILGPLSIGIQLFGFGQQIAQAAKAKRAQRSAERAAEDKIAAAKRELSVNRLEGLQIPMTAFQQAADVDLAMQQQALAGLAESDPRALAAGIGKVQAAGTQGTETRRQAMEKSLFDWEKMVAQNQQKIDQLKGSMSLQEAAGAQLARKQAQELIGQSTTGALKSLGGALQTGYEQTQLYNKEKEESPFGEIDVPKFTDMRLKNDFTADFRKVMPQYNGGFGGVGQPGAYSSGLNQYTPSPFSIGGMSGLGFQSLAPNNQGL